MGLTLREAIRETTAQHLDAGRLVMGECLSAVGWVNGTLPERQDMIELPMADVANSGFAVGAALARKRPILIIRYQGFSWFGAALIVNYAAKSKALWGVPCPLLVRSIAMEGGIGPVAGSSHHSLYHRMPGVKIVSPMTPGEWRVAYEDFMAGDDVVYLSEHRKAYDNSDEFSPWIGGHNPDIVLFPISITRFAAHQAAVELSAEGIAVLVHHVVSIKPFAPTVEQLEDLRRARCGGIVLDDDYADGTAKAIALDLHAATGARMRAIGLEDRTAGFAARVDNLPPDKDRIKKVVIEVCERSAK